MSKAAGSVVIETANVTVNETAGSEANKKAAINQTKDDEHKCYKK
jgi:hypothetical protein